MHENRNVNKVYVVRTYVTNVKFYNFHGTGNNLFSKRLCFIISHRNGLVTFGNIVFMPFLSM